MDGGDRAARQGQGQPAGQAQDHRADHRPVLHVVPLEPHVVAGFFAAGVRDRPGAHGHRGNPHAGVGRVVPACRLARDAGSFVKKSVCVFCGSAPGARPSYSAAAREMGESLARAGIALVYGGGKLGLMGIVADAVLKAGGHAIGVIPRMLIEREAAHPNLTRQHVVTTMHERKTLMAELSDAFIGLPGGMGTFDELVEIVTWAQLGLHAKPVILATIDDYFAPMYAMLDNAVKEGFVTPKSRAYWRNAESVSSVMQILGKEGLVAN